MLRFVVAATFACLCVSAFAEPVHIVAYGASNTFGKGVSRGDAYPAQLERMLKDAGHDVEVTNAGTNGVTTEDELADLDEDVPQNTQIVIFQPGTNDRLWTRKHGPVTGSAQNVDAVVQKLLDRHVLVLFLGSPPEQQRMKQLGVSAMDGVTQLSPDNVQPDGQHLTPEGYRQAAAKMVPYVEELIGKLSADK